MPRPKQSFASSSAGGAGGDTLFGAAHRRDAAVSGAVPLAERMRPRTLAELVGQAHLLGPEKLLARALGEGRVFSMILWGPPGVGKTTVGRIVAAQTNATFVPFSAVLGSVGELRVIIGEAKERLSYKGSRTIVFVDEIHRFNKGQQDAFLPHVEDGTITLIGATTENPSFAVNAALLSRCKVFRLETLGEAELVRLLERALSDESRGLGAWGMNAEPEALSILARLAGGDARRALTTLEVLAGDVRTKGESTISAEEVARSQDRAPLLYDKAGEEHYNVTSAFIKSMRGSDPDAAVYWMIRMLEAGDDPLFILRRMIIFASEDVGNADPRALTMVTSADAAFRRLGMPEGMYPLTHACVYLASTAKSNAVKGAWHRAKALVDEHGALPVPMKLRNAVTSLMKNEGYGDGYKYAHDFAEGFAPGETYLPDAIAHEVLYEPSGRGDEARIKTRLDEIRKRRDGGGGGGGESNGG